MARYQPSSLLHHFLVAFLVSFIILIDASLAATAKPTELVDKVCNQTSNYAFCVDALYSDPRTPDADSYTLAFISFGLAYISGNNTQAYIAEQLKNTSSQDHHRRLKRCSNDYQKAVSQLEEAYNDLNSETFSELAHLAGDAAQAAGDCQAGLKGIPSLPLSSRNRNLKALCEICVVVAHLFTGGS